MTNKPRDVISRGRGVLKTQPALRDAWHKLLTELDVCPQPSRNQFVEYVRLVYGTTGSITLPVDGPITVLCVCRPGEVPHMPHEVTE